MTIFSPPRPPGVLDRPVGEAGPAAEVEGAAGFGGLHVVALLGFVVGDVYMIK